MQQQCYLVSLYVSWAIYLGGASLLAWQGSYGLLLVWLLGAPLAQLLYVRVFPKVSRLMGYGRVDDEPAPGAGRASTTVTLYTALGCPFCPLVEQRLDTLRKEMGFSLQKIDVTLRADLLRNKGIRAVPVVEVGEQRIVGLATTKQLASLILAEPRAA